MIEVRNNRDDSHIYDYKGRIFFDVEDPFGYPHHEVEVIGVYDRTASVRDVETGMTWTVRKNELGLKEKKLENSTNITVILIIEKPSVNGKGNTKN